MATEILVDALTQTGIEMVNLITTELGRKAKRQTGTLRRGITFKVDAKALKVQVGFLTQSGGKINPIYAAQVNFGGTIHAKPGKFLVWEGPDGLIFAKKVTQKGLHFLKGPFGKAESVFQKKARDAVKLKLGA